MEWIGRQIAHPEDGLFYTVMAVHLVNGRCLLILSGNVRSVFVDEIR
jgi:hypothetical protein